MEEIIEAIAIVFVILICVFVPGALFVYYIKKIGDDMDKREKEQKEKLNNMSESEKKEYYDNITIDYTVIVGEDSKKSIGSAALRGAVGATIAGPVGLAAGALSAKNKNKTTFTVVYKNGRREVVTVENASYEFKKYAEYIKV